MLIIKKYDPETMDHGFFLWRKATKMLATVQSGIVHFLSVWMSVGLIQERIDKILPHQIFLHHFQEVSE